MSINYKAFIQDNFTITTTAGEVVPFIFNDVQDFFYNLLLEEYSPALQGVRENILKSRRFGFSSIIDAMFVVDFILSELGEIPMTNSDVYSYKVSDTQVLFTRVNQFLDSWLLKSQGGDYRDIAHRQQLPSLRSQFLSKDVGGTVIMGKNGAEYHCLTAGAKTSGRGGALDDDTPVPTPKGFKRHGDLSVGDIIYDRNGKETIVIGVYPQGIKDMYRVTLSDGSHLDADDDHNWEIKKNPGDEPLRVITTDEIASRVQSGKYTSIYNGDAVEYHNQDLAIDPYSLGAILGDGHIQSGKYKSGSVNVITSDAEVLENMLYGDVRTADRDIYKVPMFRLSSCKYKLGLREYGLVGALSHTKFIPSDYLISSIDQRKSLLAGLLDTDGYLYEADNRIQYDTTSQQLAKDISQLVKSLGGYCTIQLKKEDTRDRKIQSRHRLYRLNLRVDFNPFKSSRNASKWAQPQNKKWLRVVSIEKLPPKSCQCIAVDSPSHTYLAGKDFMVTHNTKQNIHWSEVAFYGNTAILDARQLVTGVEEQVSGGIGKVFRETTGNVADDFFSEEYQLGKDGLSDFKSRFLAWHNFSAYTAEAPAEWDAPAYYDKMREDGVTLDQCYWHFQKTRGLTSKLRMREYPSFDSEAFLLGGLSYWDTDALIHYAANIKEPLKEVEYATAL